METGLAPGGVSYVWQTKGLREPLFGSVAMIRLTGGFPGSVANKGVRNGADGNADGRPGSGEERSFDSLCLLRMTILVG